jgi:hypothetical protein
MTQFITNARRDLRLPIHLEAQIAVERVGYLGRTEDVGARGCRILAPLRLLTGTPLRVVLIEAGVPALLSVGGVVVWRQDAAGWRYGVAFAEEDADRAMAWFDDVAGRHAALLEHDRVPDRVRLADRVSLARPAQGPLTREEALLVGLAGSSPTVADLRLALGHSWSRAQRALFSLLNRGVVALEPARPGQPWN